MMIKKLALLLFCFGALFPLTLLYGQRVDRCGTDEYAALMLEKLKKENPEKYEEYIKWKEGYDAYLKEHAGQAGYESASGTAAPTPEHVTIKLYANNEYNPADSKEEEIGTQIELLYNRGISAGAQKYSFDKLSYRINIDGNILNDIKAKGYMIWEVPAKDDKIVYRLIVIPGR